MEETFEFTLPFGYSENGKEYRKGKMRLATTKDELEIQESDAVWMNSRYRDIIFLSKVIVELGEIRPVTVDIIKKLFEADFIYLQLFYKHISGGEGSRIVVQCPCCRNITNVNLSEIYTNMDIYTKKEGSE